MLYTFDFQNRMDYCSLRTRRRQPLLQDWSVYLCRNHIEISSLIIFVHFCAILFRTFRHEKLKSNDEFKALDVGTITFRFWNSGQSTQNLLNDIHNSMTLINFRKWQRPQGADLKKTRYMNWHAKRSNLWPHSKISLAILLRYKLFSKQHLN